MTAGGRAMPGARDGPLEVLLVEDSDTDADLMIEALRDGNLAPRVQVVEDGEQALEYLRRQGGFANARRPDLILLDLFLPRMNGHEVLAAIRAHPEWKRIPVVVLTASDNEQAFLKAYDLHANCCVCKPADQDEFALVVQKIERFWLHFVRLP